MKSKQTVLDDRKTFQSWFTILFVLLTVQWAAGQEFRGSISGEVTDSSGAAIPSARVTITNAATNVAASATTDGTGHFAVLYLTPGQYVISAEAKGFKKLVRSGIEVQVGDRLTINLPLEPGAVTEEIRVTADAPLLETSEASQGQIVDQHNIEDLPLPDGDPFVLARTAGGLAFTGNLLFARPFDNGGVSSIRASGAPGGNEFTLDGAPDMGSGLRVAFVPPSDAVQEFKVITSNFDAQQGHTAGAVVNVVSKSGSNSVHGTLYEFDRNDALSANDFFSNRLHMRKQKLRYHRWGATVGGPVYIPKLYNGKNKTFFFFAYEGLKDNQPETNTFTVPTLAERNGDFSALLAPKAGNITIYDPNTAVANGGSVSRQVLVCNGRTNVICPNRLNPIALAYLNLYPLPNIAGNEQGQNNYFSGNPRTDSFNSETLRIDHELTQKQKAFLRLYRNWRQELRGNWSSLLNGVRATGNNLFRINDGIDYDEVYTISPTTLLDARLGYARFTEYNRRPSEFSKFDPATLGWSPQVLALFRGAKYLPRFNIDKFSALGDTVGDTTTFNIYSFQPTLTKIFGGHSLRFGYDFRAYRENNINPSSQAGTYTFNSDYTRQKDSSSGQIGQGLAAFLLGQPTGGSIDINTTRANQTIYQGIFVQDDWKATRKLTLNIGLRYEYEGATTERFDRNVRGFDATDPNPIAAAAMAAYALNPIKPTLITPNPVTPNDFHVSGGLLYADSSHRGFWRPDKTNFQPRLGFAYALADRTVVRGGWAIFSVPFIINGLNAGGFSQATDLVPTLDKGVTFQANLADPFPSGVITPPNSSKGLATFVGTGLGTIVPLNRRNGRAQQWLFNIQRQLTKDWKVQVSYVGLRAYDLDTGVDLNPIPAQYLSTLPTRDLAKIDDLGAGVTNPFNSPYDPKGGLVPGTGLNGATISKSQLLRPFPEFTTINSRASNGKGSYDSLMISTDKRMSHGLTASGSYTFSKLLDQTSKLNATDTHYSKRLSGNDIPNRVTASFIWELPFGPGRHWGSNWHGPADKFLGGWQAGGIYYYQTGFPLTFGNWVYFGDPRQLRTHISGATVDNVFPTAGFYFTDAAVQTNGVVDPAKQRSDKRIQLSNNIRTLPFTESGLRGQPLNYWEGINVIKKTSIGERVNTELRFSFQNPLNHPQFNGPNLDPTSSNFAKVTDQVGFSLPRNIEVGMKIKF